MLRGIWARIVLLVVTLAVSVGVVLLAIPLRRWVDISIRAMRVWGGVMLAAVGARPVYHGLEHVDHGAPQVFIANHQSAVDVWVMPRCLPLNTRFVAKQELFRIPLFGWAMTSVGFIPIDRKRRSRAVKSLDAAAERIRSGCSVVLYAEGSRSHDGTLQPFKKGAFHLALKAGVPVVPIVIAGSYRVWPRGRWRVTPGQVDVYIESPIDVGEFRTDDPRALLEHVRGVISRRLNEP